jgi:hypothetical protein
MPPPPKEVSPIKEFEDEVRRKQASAQCPPLHLLCPRHTEVLSRQHPGLWRAGGFQCTVALAIVSQL